MIFLVAFSFSCESVEHLLLDFCLIRAWALELSCTHVLHIQNPLMLTLEEIIELKTSFKTQIKREIWSVLVILLLISISWFHKISLNFSSGLVYIPGDGFQLLAKFFQMTRCCVIDNKLVTFVTVKKRFVSRLKHDLYYRTGKKSIW